MAQRKVPAQPVNPPEQSNTSTARGRQDSGQFTAAPVNTSERDVPKQPVNPHEQSNTSNARVGYESWRFTAAPGHQGGDMSERNVPAQPVNPPEQSNTSDARGGQGSGQDIATPQDFARGPYGFHSAFSYIGTSHYRYRPSEARPAEPRPVARQSTPEQTTEEHHVSGDRGPALHPSGTVSCKDIGPNPFNFYTRFPSLATPAVLQDPPRLPADPLASYHPSQDVEIPTNAYEAAGYRPDYERRPLASPSPHPPPSPQQNCPGQARMRDPPPELNGLFSVADQSPYSTDGTDDTLIAQARHSEPVGRSMIGIKRSADGFDESDKENYSPPAAVEPTLAFKKRISKSNNPSATTPASGKYVPAPTRKVRIIPSRETSEEHDETYREEEPEQDTAPTRDTPLPSVEGGGESPVRTRAARRRAEAEASTVLAQGQAQGQTQAPAAAPAYVYSNTLLGLRKAIGEPNWKEFLELVELFVDEDISETQFTRGQRRIFHSQSELFDRQARRLTETMVREARGM
ncbi:hypothetical protein P171DRAFT_449780 [Karstenula rhodostoma CBS 690.94]|uniref:Uncharacterized protein n=1 Tax=Karstenula rhodostoma CBS 690.94 TaxID=1392251 RepID=A0A9P4P6Q3_9PLEO|nr:hypothetical protein P171DRAFT_449780 [Karstenula rhodostoma CBS 690.94]